MSSLLHIASLDGAVWPRSPDFFDIHSQLGCAPTANKQPVQLKPQAAPEEW
jgi:hypothetical protein